MPRTHWWNRIFPRRQDLEKRITRRRFERAGKTVKQERRRFEKPKEGPLAPLHSKVHRFLNTYTFSLKSFDDGLGALSNEFTEARSAAETVRHAALCEIETVRDQMLLDFRGRVSKIYLTLCQTIAGSRGRLQASLDESHKQASPLGIELPDWLGGTEIGEPPRRSVASCPTNFSPTYAGTSLAFRQRQQRRLLV
jgi:hypothetical protein